MEAVSFAVSIVALASLFETALDCFKHVKVAKSFGSDYETNVLRLQSLRLRFSRCSQAVTATNSHIGIRLSGTEIRHAESLVEQIIQLFSETEGLADEFSSKSGDMIAIDEDVEGLKNVGKLSQRIRAICLRRQQTTGIVKKAKWSLYSRDKFVELINDMQSLVDDLGELFFGRAGHEEERSLCNQEAEELGHDSAISTLRTIALTQDGQLAEAIARTTETVSVSLFNFIERTLRVSQTQTGKQTIFRNNDNTKIVNQADSQMIYGGQNITL
nr:heterokaryon incompatibility protein s [Quercus suber]